MTPELPDPLRVALRVIDALDAMRIAYHIGGSYASEDLLTRALGGH